MRKKLLAIIATAAMVVAMVPSMVFATGVNPCNENPCTHVAKVGDTHYADLQEAIKAAAPSGTVEIVKDVTVEEWKMFSGTLTHADIITKEINGLTINGNNHVLTINNIKDGTNGGYLFRDVENLNIKDLTIVVNCAGSGGISINSGVIDNVTFEGGSCGILPGNGPVTINECTFITNGAAVYYEHAADNLTVSKCIFNIADDANIIILRGKEKFTDNTINRGRTVNIASGSPEVSGNTFNNNVRLKVYNDATAIIENNKKITNLEFSDPRGTTKSEFKGNELNDAAKAALTAVGGENKPADPTSTPGSQNKPTPESSPNTGDNSMAPFAVAGLALAALAAVVATRRRTN